MIRVVIVLKQTTIGPEQLEDDGFYFAASLSTDLVLSTGLK